MSLQTLRAELEKLNLTPRVDNLIGRPLLMNDEKGFTVCGAITSVDYSPEVGISFRTSSPTFYGIEIREIIPKNDGTAMVRTLFDELSYICSFEII